MKKHKHIYGNSSYYPDSCTVCGHDRKKPYFIKEPFGLPAGLQPTGKFRRPKKSYRSGD